MEEGDEDVELEGDGEEDEDANSLPNVRYKVTPVNIVFNNAPGKASMTLIK